MAATDDIHRTQKRKRLRLCRQHRTIPPPLPTELMLEIARRTDDPVTIARCAATCKELRRQISNPSFRSRRLRLRLGEQFAPPSLVLRGQLVGRWGRNLYLEDNTTAVDGANKNLITINAGFFKSNKERCMPIAARGGLVLVRVLNHLRTEELRVYSPVTGRSQSLPLGPTFNGQYVLLVGDGDGDDDGVVGVGRPFQVLKAASELSKHSRHHYLRIQTFSSSQGAWGPCTRIPSPFERTCCSLPPPAKQLVIGDAVHWLCRNDNSNYVFKLRVGAGDDDEGRLTMMKLPPSFPRARSAQMLLATAWAAGSPAVLVANQCRISAWTLSGSTGRWTDQPHVVMENEALQRLIEVHGGKRLGRVRLEWFAERSGVVMLSATRCRFLFWLHLQSGQIIRHYSGSLDSGGCPYEIRD